MTLLAAVCQMRSHLGRSGKPPPGRGARARGGGARRDLRRDAGEHQLSRTARREGAVGRDPRRADLSTFLAVGARAFHPSPARFVQREKPGKGTLLSTAVSCSDRPVCASRCIARSICSMSTCRMACRFANRQRSRRVLRSSLPRPAFGGVGLSICYDLRFGELYRALVARGAVLLTIPSAFTAITGRAHWEILVRARAIEVAGVRRRARAAWRARRFGAAREPRPLADRRSRGGASSPRLRTASASRSPSSTSPRSRASARRFRSPPTGGCRAEGSVRLLRPPVRAARRAPAACQNPPVTACARRPQSRRELRRRLRDRSQPAAASTSFSTTAGSARVVMSPRSLVSPAAILRRMRRMILPERVFGRPGRDEDPVRSGDRADRLAHLLLERAHQLLRIPGLELRRDEDVGEDAGALDVVREADHRRLGDRRVRDQRALDLGGAQPMAGDVEHVVDAAGDPVVAVLVAAAAVAGEVEPGIAREVGLAEARVIAPDRPRLAGPGAPEAEVARHAVAVELLALLVDQHRLDAEERQRRRAGLGRRRAGQRRDQDAAGLGLPPGVDHRAAPVADDVVVPVSRPRG